MSQPRQAGDRRPTLRDVAGLAGVSTSTASLVFSGKGPVSPATADRVRAAAEELGFAGPDPLASSLRQGRVGTVAVVVEAPLRDAFRDPFALAVLDGLAEELEAAGRSMLLVAQPADDPVRAVGQLATQAVDAAVFPLCGLRDNPVVAHLGARGIPLVGAGSPADPGVAHVRVDEAGAIGLTTRHVLGLGHTRVASVAMALHPGATTRAVTAADLDGALYPMPAGACEASGTSWARTPPSSRPPPSPSGPARRPAASSSTAPRRSARPPWSSRPTCSRPASSARPRPSGSTSRVRCPSPGSTGSTCRGSTRR